MNYLKNRPASNVDTLPPQKYLVYDIYELAPKKQSTSNIEAFTQKERRFVFEYLKHTELFINIKTAVYKVRF